MDGERGEPLAEHSECLGATEKTKPRQQAERSDNAATKRAAARAEAHDALLNAWEEIDQTWGRVTTRENRDRLDRAVNGIKTALDALDLPYVRTRS